MPNQPLAPTKHRISVHFPKVGGSTLRHLLRKKFPRPYPEIYDGHLAMNPTFSMATAFVVNFKSAGCAPDVRVVQDHCPPVRFEFGQNVRFRAFPRNPVDRGIFSYRHRLGGHQIQPGEAVLLTRAAMLRPSNHRRRYLRGFPIERFDFMGVTDGLERAEVSWSKFLVESSLSLCIGHWINLGKRAAKLSCYVSAPRRETNASPNSEWMPICDRASPRYSCGRTRTTMCYPG